MESNQFYIHMAYCPNCKGVRHIHIGPSMSQHVCEDCGKAVDPTYTKSVVLTVPPTKVDTSVTDSETYTSQPD